MFELLFLGTSAGVPTRSRNVSATALLEGQGKGWYLIDCGEATQHQLLRAPLALSALRAICITHVHGDHCYGLPGLLSSAAMAGRQEALDLIGPAALEPWLAETFRMSASYLPFELRFHPVEEGGPWRFANVAIDCTALSHRVPSWGYGFTETRPEPRLDVQRLIAEGVPKGPIWGALMHQGDQWCGDRLLRAGDYRLAGRPPRRVVVCGDNDTPALLEHACVGADVLVHEATYSQAVLLDGKQAYGHSSAEGVARFAASVGLPHLVLTHFSPRYQAAPGRGPQVESLREEAAAHFGGGLWLARDFLHLALGREGGLSERK
ncbi:MULTISPECIES: ribonuclease Z [unclassified Pseudomonas]|uniref:ribonuclease Z n=1 Tax=unclassified Pseudomonas TaxID=196821 RepID=UPI000BD726D4|nr:MULTISPECIES: ribonuclease Z [unclassified Pseudomonas]PVZ20241.1 ribonuclease Z [Pseudomonas sp. URIL14HWK12:I12]PVZ27307.1 ribonuclease Z [Pseudomonas sp. URIL14HWK12:I10]PVZ38196.1 ribonuclease Z [Pseudomonas sp. URIL14HWK12:I11]SNZ04274.1 RNAse Z [Pseudomonas sp. URIL14HWK12:I9]